MALYMVWTDGHDMECYGLADMAWYVVWPGGNNMVFSLAWQACHGIWYGLTCMVWYGLMGMVLGMVWYML